MQLTILTARHFASYFRPTILSHFLVVLDFVKPFVISAYNFFTKFTSPLRTPLPLIQNVFYSDLIMIILI
jgi:hypothetical protein